MARRRPFQKPKPLATGSAMAAHAKLSASKMKQIINCPGSVAAQAGIPSRESKAAKDGTAAHWMAEQVLIEWQRERPDLPTVPPSKPVDLVGAVADNGVTCTLEMARGVEHYVDAVQERAAGADLVLIEAKLTSLTKLDADLGGTSDCVIVNRSTRTLHVGDYKNGAGVFVSPEENEQALTYGTGAILLPEIGRHLAEIERVELFIVQPNAGGPPVKTWDTDPVRLMEWAVTLQQAAAASRDPNAPRRAGDHCQFCLVKGSCDAHYSLALDAAGLTPIDFFGGEDGQIPRVAAPDALSPEELAKRLARAEHLERWVKAIKEQGLRQALEGKPPAGFKAVAGRGSRKFKDPRAAVKLLAEWQEVDETEFYVSEPMSVAQVENHVGKKDLKGFSFAELVDSPETGMPVEVHRNWGDLWKMTPGNPTLVAASDPRPEIDKRNGFDDVSDFDLVSASE